MFHYEIFLNHQLLLCYFIVNTKYFQVGMYIMYVHCISTKYISSYEDFKYVHLHTIVCRIAWGQDGKMRMDDGGFFLAISLFNIQNMRRQFPFILARSSLDTYVYDYVYRNPNPKIKNWFE